jgi:hypothetical protein
MTRATARGQRNGRRPVVTRDRNFSGQTLGRRDECPGHRRVRLADEKRHARVAPFANRLIDRNAADEGHAQLVGHPLAAALPEDIRLVPAVRAHEMTHVLDHADRRDVQLLVHRDRPAAVRQRYLLRRRHHDRARDRDGLAEGERDVAGARRHVDDEVVEIDPPRLAKELLERAVEHRSPPDDRRVLGRQEAHRHHLQAELLRGQHLLAIGRDLNLRETEHDRHVRPVDVGVDHADPAARLGERDRKIHGDGRLAHAAFPRAHGDDVLHAGHRRSSALAARHRFAHARAHLHVDSRDAGHGHHGRPGLIAHLILHGTGRRRQLDRERNPAGVDCQILDEAERDDVAMEVGILDDLEGLQNAGLFDGHIVKNTVRRRSPSPVR